MHIDKHAPQLLPFLVALHLGTAFALLWYFRTRWIELIGGWFASLGGRRNEDGHMMWALIIGTIPTGIVGLVLEKRLERVFHDLRIVAIALIVNGVLLWLGDRLQRSRAHRRRRSSRSSRRSCRPRADRRARSRLLAQRPDDDRGQLGGD